MVDDTEQVIEATEQATPIVEPAVDQQAVEKRAEELYQARNFKMLREQAEQNARRAEAAEREAYSLKQKYEQQGPKKAAQFNIGDDELVEGKHLAQFKAYADEKAQEQSKQLEEYKAMVTEQAIRNQCPDFDSVVTNENLARLAQEYPEIAASLKSSNDVKATAISAYKLIKKFEIHNPQLSLDKETIAKNLAKPKPSNALPKSETDLARANAFEKGLTDAEKEAKYKQMREFARQN